MSSSDGAQSDGSSDGAQGTLSPVKPPKKTARKE